MYTYIDGTEMTDMVDVDNDELYDYNWYIIESKSSVSAAVVTPAIAQENNLATILGHSQYGGSTATEQILFPCGFFYSFPINETFLIGDGNVVDGYTLTPFEYGIDVDIPLVDLYNDEELIQVINDHQDD